MTQAVLKFVARSCEARRAKKTAWQRRREKETPTPGRLTARAKRPKARGEMMEIDPKELLIPLGPCPRCGLTIEAPMSVLMTGGVVSCLCGLHMQAGREPWVIKPDEKTPNGDT